MPEKFKFGYEISYMATLLVGLDAPINSTLSRPKTLPTLNLLAYVTSKNKPIRIFTPCI
jgi:hypothetical protein